MAEQQKQKRARKKSTNYLNNNDLLAETVKSLDQGAMTDKLAHMLMTLVERYGKKGNFANYTYNDDMQAYALMMLVRTWQSFKPDRSRNAFAFFTQCVKNSFIQYLNQERRQRDIRDEMLVSSGLSPSHTYTLANEQSREIEDEEDYESQHKIGKIKTVDSLGKPDDSMLVY